MTKRKITIEEQEKLFALLRLHCRVEGDGFAAYDDGWNDATIATAVAPDLSLSSVITARRSLIGKLRASPGEGVAQLLRRVEVLEQQMHKIVLSGLLDAVEQSDE